MPVCLTVVNEEAEQASASTHWFDDLPITIGRRPDNQLTLEDPKRIVSGYHAVVRRDNGTFCLVDQESKNFTYVEGRRLPAGEPHELETGEAFRIGDFRITFHGQREGPSAARAEDTSPSGFDTAHTGAAATLVEALEALVAAHRQLAAEQREEVWQVALDETAESSDAVLEPIRAALDDSAPAPDPEASGAPPDGAAATRQDEEAGGAPDRVVDVLAEAVAMMVRVPWRFRHEFIGQTMRQDPEKAFLYRGEGEALRTALLETSLTEEARRRRLEAVTEEAEALIRHQVAMLEGYRAGVEAGTEHLLVELDPDTHRENAGDAHRLHDYLPVLAKGRAFEHVRDAWEEVHRTDAATLERRVFRPAFTKAYLARMTAPPSEEAPTPSRRVG